MNKTTDQQRYQSHIRRVKQNASTAGGESVFLTLRAALLGFAFASALVGMVVNPLVCGILAVVAGVLLIHANFRAVEYAGILRAGRPATERFIARLERDYDRQYRSSSDSEYKSKDQ